MERAKLSVDYRRPIVRANSFQRLQAVGALLCAFVLALPLSAQTFRGVVIDDSTRRPLDNALVSALDSKGQDLRKPAVRTDSLGRFVLHIGERGKYQLRVNRIGYLPLTSSTITFNGGEAVTVTLRMTVSAVKLGAVVVTDRRHMNLYELMSVTGFDLRRSKGRGLFLDTLDLAEFKTLPILFLLEDYSAGPKVFVTYDKEGRPRVKFMQGAKECDPEIWINGFVAVEKFDGLRLAGLGADQIHGVEVYNRVTMPPASLGAEIGTHKGSCGSIVVWTKGFAEEMRKKGEKIPTVPPPLPDMKD